LTDFNIVGIRKTIPVDDVAPILIKLKRDLHQVIAFFDRIKSRRIDNLRLRWFWFLRYFLAWFSSIVNRRIRG
jgi:hypothetical protein